LNAEFGMWNAESFNCGFGIADFGYQKNDS
jgi:hypothetical protein